MLISETGAFGFGLEAPEAFRAIVGKRVLITGVTSRRGIDIARSFTEAGARVILQSDEASPAIQALAELLAPDAAELSLHAAPLKTSEEIVTFARQVVAEFGGLDIVINIVDLDGAPPAALDSIEAVEAQVSDVLLKACLVSRVAANRMRLTLTDGVVLTFATLANDANSAERAFAQVVRSTLAAMTRREADAWAGQGIQFNAVAPDVSGLGGGALGAETDVARLALYLGGGGGKTLSGQTFDLALLARD